MKGFKCSVIALDLLTKFFIFAVKYRLFLGCGPGSTSESTDCG